MYMYFAVLLIAGLCSGALVAGAPLSDFYPYGPSNGDSALPKGDDNGLELQLPLEMVFYGRRLSSVHVSS